MMKAMDYRLFDTHCHPQFPQFDEDRDEVILRARDRGIGMLCVGTDLESSRSAIKLAERYEGVFASVGLHPNEALNDLYDSGYAEQYRVLLGKERVVAVGEIGLDYYRTKDDEFKRRQRDRLVKQFRMATGAKLPVIIHCRDAHEDLKAILTTDEFRNHLTGVIHSFTGTWDDAKTYLGLGFHIGLNGIITFAREYDETVKNMPLNMMLLETDAPYLTPSPYRGKRNEPLYIEEVVQIVATLRQESREVIEKVTTLNAIGTFIKPQ